MADLLAFPAGQPLPDPAGQRLLLIARAISAVSAAGIELATASEHILAGGSPETGALAEVELLTSIFTAVAAISEATGQPPRDRAVTAAIALWLQDNGRLSA